MLRIYSGKASPCSRIQQDTCEAQLLLQRCAVICVVCFALQQWVYIICISNEYVHVLHFICVIVCVCLKVYALMTWDGAVSHPYHLLVLAYNPSGQAQTDESSSWLPDPNFTLCCISYQVCMLPVMWNEFDIPALEYPWSVCGWWAQRGCGFLQAAKDDGSHLIMDMLLFFTNILRPICSPLFLFSWRGFFNCVLILATPECEVTSKHRREKPSGYKLT